MNKTNVYDWEDPPSWLRSMNSKSERGSPMIKPQVVQDADIIFGGDIEKLMVPMEEIPKEFKSSHNKWVWIFSTWFFSGIPGAVFEPADGIDSKLALRHISAIMRSWAPQHEHKTACCAYLMSLWFKDVVIPAKK